MKNNFIEIQVMGTTGIGKTHVCDVIKDALVRAYGQHTQIASYELSVTQAQVNNLTPPKVQDSVFVIRECNADLS